jgi:hypothetical protein
LLGEGEIGVWLDDVVSGMMQPATRQKLFALPLVRTSDLQQHPAKEIVSRKNETCAGPRDRDRPIAGLRRLDEVKHNRGDQPAAREDEV